MQRLVFPLDLWAGRILVSSLLGMVGVPSVEVRAVRVKFALSFCDGGLLVWQIWNPWETLFRGCQSEGIFQRWYIEDILVEEFEPWLKKSGEITLVVTRTLGIIKSNYLPLQGRTTSRWGEIKGSSLAQQNQKKVRGGIECKLWIHWGSKKGYLRKWTLLLQKTPKRPQIRLRWQLEDPL